MHNKYPIVRYLHLLVLGLVGSFFFGCQSDVPSGLFADTPPSNGLGVSVQALQLVPDSVTLGTGKTKQFLLTGGVAPYTYSVSGLGTINSSGLYSAGSSTGFATVSVIDGSGNIDTASITILESPVVTPSGGSLVSHSSTSFSVAGGTGPYTWSIASGSGTISSTGFFESERVEETVTVRATDSNGIYGEATVNVFVPIQIAAGSLNTCFQNYAGAIKCLGYNYSGNLGRNAGNCVGCGPNQMGNNLLVRGTSSSSTFDRIEASTDKVCVKSTDGGLKCIGYYGLANVGQSITGQSVNTFYGDRISESLDNLRTIGFGDGRSVTDFCVHKRSGGGCALLDNGNVKCWGRNNKGDAGQDSTTTIGNNADGLTSVAAVNLGVGRTAIDVSCGFHLSCAVLDNNEVKCWGKNNYGQLGQGNTTQLGDGAGEMAALNYIDLGTGFNAVKVEAGYEHACALNGSGQVKCWGRNTHAQLGVGDLNNRGDNGAEMGGNLPYVNVGSGLTVSDISAGVNTTCVKLSDGSSKCWGYNSSGALGMEIGTAYVGRYPGDMGNNLANNNWGSGRTVSKINAGDYSTCAILDNDDLKCAGDNNFGKLGQGHNDDIGDEYGEMGDNLSPISLPSGTYATDVSSSQYYTCVLLSNNKFTCFGFNYGGVVSHSYGVGDDAGENPVTVNLPDGTTSSTIGYNNDTGRVLLSDGTLRAWGGDGHETGNGAAFGTIGDHYGEMGSLMPAVDLGGRVPKALYTGKRQTCVTFADNSGLCFGINSHGNLGQENTTSYGNISYDLVSLPTINVGAGRTIKKFFLTKDRYDTCAILDNDRIKCFGQNQFGELGDGHTSKIGDGAGEMGDALPYVDLATGFTVQDGCGGYASFCALGTNGVVKCWGRGAWGNLGNGSTASVGDGAGEMGAALVAVNLGTGLTAKKITCGLYHVCAILNNDRVKCWGHQSYVGQGSAAGHLGDSGGADMGDNLPYVDIGTGKTALEIEAGELHTCVTRNDNSVVCWGDSAYGQTGAGTDEIIGDGPGEMGDNLTPVNLGW